MNLETIHEHRSRLRRSLKQVWLKLDVPEGSTVLQAIERSGLLDLFPEIDLERQKVGIFGKVSQAGCTCWRREAGWRSTAPSPPTRRAWNGGTLKPHRTNLPPLDNQPASSAGLPGILGWPQPRTEK
jgi:hypothetical protein